MKTKTLLLSAALCSSVLASAQGLNVELAVGGNIDKTVFSQLDSFSVANSLNLKDATILAATVGGVEYPANTIPDSAFMTKGYVNANGVFVFTGNKEVTSVVLPASITAIGASAFNGSVANPVDFSACTKLETIKTYAFELSAMDKIDLSGLSALQTIEANALKQTHAASIVLDGCSSLTAIDQYGLAQSYFVTSTSFKGCTALKTIGNRAFLNLGKTSGDCGEIDLTPCTALETIDESAFQSAKTKSVKFPASLKTIAAKAFNLASLIETITFEGTTPPTLGATAFTAKIMSNAIVYVPAGSEQAYKDAGFENVQAIGTPVTAARMNATAEGTAYDLNGRQAADSAKGVIIQNGQKYVK